MANNTPAPTETAPTETVSPVKESGTVPGAELTKRPVEAADESLPAGGPVKQFEYIKYSGTHDTDYINFLNNGGANGYQMKTSLSAPDNSLIIIMEREVPGE